MAKKRRAYLCRCSYCGKEFIFPASNKVDLYRKLRATTNCYATRHVAVPSMSSYVDYLSAKETFLENLFE